MVALAAEFILLFAILPVAVLALPRSVWSFPLLWLVALYCYGVLRRQHGFISRSLWSPPSAPRTAPSILALFIPAAASATAAVALFAPTAFLSFPRNRPGLWAAVMLLYPLLSVIPQTIIYRVFIFHRYRPLFPTRTALILASAVAFSWVHIVMRNPLAPALTLLGGLLFAWRYAKTGSVLVSAAEHALYGCLIFTIGLGGYFYMGAAR